jgi:hypothetical protein
MIRLIFESTEKESTSGLSAQMVGDQNFLLAAKFCTNKRHEYQNEMLQNYLQNVKVGGGGVEATIRRGGNLDSPEFETWILSCLSVCRRAVGVHPS